MVGPIEATIADEVGQRLTRLVLFLGYAFLGATLLALVASFLWPAEGGLFLLFALGCAVLAAILLFGYHLRGGATRTP